MKFEGVFPILATPFDDDEELDLESLDRLVRFMASLGVDGITILGVLGESNRLIDDERDRVISSPTCSPPPTSQNLFLFRSRDADQFRYSRLFARHHVRRDRAQIA
jgi:hypothetical protein